MCFSGIRVWHSHGCTTIIPLLSEYLFDLHRIPRLVERFRLYLKRLVNLKLTSHPYPFSRCRAAKSKLGSHTTDCPIIYVITREQSLPVVLFHLSVKSGSKCSESQGIQAKYGGAVFIDALASIKIR